MSYLGVGYQRLAEILHQLADLLDIGVVVHPKRQFHHHPVA